MRKIAVARKMQFVACRQARVPRRGDAPRPNGDAPRPNGDAPRPNGDAPRPNGNAREACATVMVRRCSTWSRAVHRCGVPTIVWYPAELLLLYHSVRCGALVWPVRSKIVVYREGGGLSSSLENRLAWRLMVRRLMGPRLMGRRNRNELTSYYVYIACRRWRWWCAEILI